MSRADRDKRTPAAEAADERADRDVADSAGALPVEAGGPPEADTSGAGPPTAEVAAPPGGDEDPAVLRDRWLRAEAELQNYRRRAAREREEARRTSEESVMLEVIAALDDLERALTLARESGAADSWVEGVRLVAGRLVDYLMRQGVVEMEPEGCPFDPAFHEAVLEMEVPGAAPGEVTQVIRKGWRRGARALRAARVVVARAPAGDP